MNERKRNENQTERKEHGTETKWKLNGNKTGTERKWNGNGMERKQKLTVWNVRACLSILLGVSQNQCKHWSGSYLFSEFLYKRICCIMASTG